MVTCTQKMQYFEIYDSISNIVGIVFQNEVCV